MRTRHELVAHSDSVARPVYVVPKLATEQGLPSPREYVSVKIESYYYPPQVFADAYDTCTDLINRMSDRIDELIEELYEGQELPDKSFRLDFSDGV